MLGLGLGFRFEFGLGFRFEFGFGFDLDVVERDDEPRRLGELDQGVDGGHDEGGAASSE